MCNALHRITHWSHKVTRIAIVIDIRFPTEVRIYGTMHHFNGQPDEKTVTTTVTQRLFIEIDPMHSTVTFRQCVVRLKFW